MYEAFFGLREAPFNNTPDPRWFFPTGTHEEALASLVYAASEEKGPVMLLAEPGAGKTLLARMMAARLESATTVVWLSEGCTTPTEILESVCAEFGVETSGTPGRVPLIRAIRHHLAEERAAGRKSVLVVDGAEALGVEGLTQLRMLDDLEWKQAKVLQLVLLGQPELGRLIGSSRLHPLRQRLFRVLRLGPLNREQTGAYILHRLTCAGGQCADVFSPPAVDLIYAESGGIPRVINTVCDYAMLSAYADQRRVVSLADVREALAELPAVDARIASDESPRCSLASHRRVPSSPVAPESAFSPHAELDANLESLGAIVNRIDHLERQGRAIALLEDRLEALNERTCAVMELDRSRPEASRPSKGDPSENGGLRLVAETAALTEGEGERDETYRDYACSVRRWSDTESPLLTQLNDMIALLSA